VGSYPAVVAYPRGTDPRQIQIMQDVQVWVANECWDHRAWLVVRILTNSEVSKAHANLPIAVSFGSSFGS
jgi:hypothetical protein